MPAEQRVVRSTARAANERSTLGCARDAAGWGKWLRAGSWCLSALALAAPARSGPAPVPLSVGFQTIHGSGSSPLMDIYVGEEMSFQAYHRTIPGSGQFFPSGLHSPADMGVFARVGSTLFAPNFTQHGGSATGSLGSYTPWTPVAFSVLTGNGNPGNPWTYTVTADAGTTGLRLEMTVTYLNSDNYFFHNLKFRNLGGTPLTFDAFIGSDLYLAGSDAGIPQKVPPTNSVGGMDCSGGGYSVLHIPLTPADHYTAVGYNSVWTQIGAGDLNDVVATGCIDNGAGLEWTDRTLQPGGSLILQSATSFGGVPNIATTYTGINKDLQNATGSAADEVVITVQGTYTSPQSVFSGGFPTFTVTNSGGQTHFSWSGMTVPNNGLVHVGFVVAGPSITISAVTWKSNGLVVGCARQVNSLYGTHTSGTHQVEYANGVLDCAATPLYVGNLSVEYYDVAPPLAELNPMGVRFPIQVDVIPGPPALVAPGATEAVLIPDPPSNAHFAVLDFQVGTSSSLAPPDVTRDFVLLPLEMPGIDEPGTRVCFGDGTGTGCPCANNGGIGQGCANGTGAGGVLSSSGTASVTNDTMSLTADGVINNNGLFFQGNNTIAGGAGSVFGDGIRCCGGSVVRIQIVNPPGSASPATAQMTETATTNGPAGTITAGTKKCYQYWYRDPASSPCGAQFNLTNAVSITWAP